MGADLRAAHRGRETWEVLLGWSGARQARPDFGLRPEDHRQGFSREEVRCTGQRGLSGPLRRPVPGETRVQTRDLGDLELIRGGVGWEKGELRRCLGVLEVAAPGRLWGMGAGGFRET